MNQNNKDNLISFKSFLKTKLEKFVEKFGDSFIASDLLAEFVVVLSSYQEEGTQLFPVVFIAEGLTELLSLTQGIEPIIIGQAPQNRESVRQAFKQCAPLSDGREWAIFVILKKSMMVYGIFRTNLSPLNPTPFEKLRLVKNNDSKIVGLTRLGRNFVEVRTPTGLIQYVNMAGDYDETTNPKKIIRSFMDIATKDSPKTIQASIRPFFYRVGIDILHANHGTIMAVIPHESVISNFFHDGIILKKRIHVSTGISNFHISKNLTDYQQLYAWNQLIRKMASMDGVTILDSSGSIVGFNCFVESKSANATHGGARLRAFKALKSYLGKDLKAVVYKSQDGIVKIGMSK